MHFRLNVDQCQISAGCPGTGHAGAEPDETEDISHPLTPCLVSGQMKRMDCVS